MLPGRPRRHGRLAKSHRTYREPDSDSDFDLDVQNTRTQPTRFSSRIQSYRESSTTDVSLSADFESDSDPAVRLQHEHSRSKAPCRGRRAVRRSQRNKQTSKTQVVTPSSTQLSSFKRRKLSHPDNLHHKQLKEIVDDVWSLPVNLRAPPWQTLEYQILLKIMQYAAYPLYSSTFRSRPSIEWLIGISKLCKSFHDAVVSALLWEPPLLPSFRAHGLIALLSQDQEKMTTNHRTKIRSLNIEVKHLLVKKSGIDLRDLLKHTPLLSHLRIYHVHDEMIGKAIWAEPTFAHFKWLYHDLFDWLDEGNISLRSFEWNGRFQDTITSMQLAHQRPCMRALEKLSVVNLNFADKQEADQSRTRNDVITALSSLQNLRSLEFRNCTILDLSFMRQLPLGLRSLTIVNCLYFTSDSVEAYLTIGGNTIQTLHFEGNRVMDLAFMANMSELCPNLEDLYVDLSYEDSSSYHDRGPLYDELLPRGSPTWPALLNSIIVGPLRMLDVSDAEDFYKSLINSADSLPYLRTLSIKTILNDADWRDRARMRQKWRPLFEKVFAARKSDKPSTAKPTLAKSKRLPRKSVRLQELEEASISEDVDDESELPDGITTVPRQNRCEVVEFELSDQRPAQEQWREADFLDSERSGDEEWNGRDQSPVGTGYAWR